MFIKKGHRIPWIDLLRGAAILLVMMFHFTARYGEKNPNNMFSDNPLLQVRFGWIGVYLFFMISGFIIYLTIQNKSGPVEFLVARLSRLIPPYWAAIVLILVLESLHVVVFDIPNRNDLVTTLINMAMIPDIMGARYLDGAFWSLFVEIKFYFLFAILWQIIELKKNRTFYFSYLILFLFASFHNLTHLIPRGNIFNYFLFFWTGIAACKVLTERMPLKSYIIITALTGISGLYLEGKELLIATPFFSIFMVIGERVFNEFPRVVSLLSPLRSLGRISYSYYLIHQPIGYLLLGALASLSFNYNLAILFSILICFCVARFGFMFIERLDKPIAKYIFNKIEQERIKFETKSL